MRDDHHANIPAEAERQWAVRRPDGKPDEWDDGSERTYPSKPGARTRLGQLRKESKALGMSDLWDESARVIVRTQEPVSWTDWADADAAADGAAADDGDTDAGDGDE